MTPTEIHKALGPAVANIVIMRGEQRISSGTGFLVGRHLVTCAHVMAVPANCDILVRFEKVASGQTAEWSFPAAHPVVYRGHSAEHSFDYAIIEPPAGAALGSGLEFAPALPEPGQRVCGLGYPFDDPHLTINQGIVAAVFSSGPATMLKLDMSVNPSNSGGPLVCEETGKVLGLIARKATGLTNAFEELLKSFDTNIAVLQSATRGGSAQIMGIDPISALTAGQAQMKAVSQEIYRSANVGIGYAIWNDPLKNESALQ